MTRRYLMVIPVPAYRNGPDSFEIESAFAQHLRTLRAKLGPLAHTLVVAAPELSAEQRAPLHLETVRADEGILFRAMFPASLGGLRYYQRLPAIMKALSEEIEKADVVHAGPSDLNRPFEFPALLLGASRGKKTISVTDIDSRNSAKMNYVTGRWSLREYVTTKLIHANLHHLQHTIAARRFSLVMLKGRALADDYGKGRPNVKNFLDSAFETRHLIPPDRLEQKASAVLQRSAPLHAIYFGRLTGYKGIDHMLRALRVALDLGANVKLSIVGSGEDREALERLAAELKLQDRVAFLGAVRFGEPLFELLYDAHVLLAAPLSEDTPRSALDAFASGQSLIAYDTYYYRDLAQSGAPVELVKWLDAKAMGEMLARVEANRERLSEQLRSARVFAEPNTQEAWLDTRVEWTKSLFEV